MRFINLVYLFLFSFLLFSCSKNKMPVSIGQDYEIIVVCGQSGCSGSVEDTIRNTLARNVAGLPEAEPEFDLVFVSQKDFSKIIQTHRNILVIDIKPSLKNNEVETLSDVWSQPQRVIKIKAKSDTALISLFAKHKDAIRDLFSMSESKRLDAQNARSRNAEAENILETNFGIKMAISKDFKLAKKTSDFLWLKTDTNANGLGLMIYTYPFKDTSMMNPAAVLAVRERYAKNLNASSFGGTYLALKNNNFMPDSHKILFKKMYALETKGLWIPDGDSLAGPFINYTIVDAPRERIVVFDGYVNYPGKPKRNFIRQLESVIWGAEFRELPRE